VTRSRRAVLPKMGRFGNPRFSQSVNRGYGQNGNKSKQRHGSMEINQLNGDKASLGGKMFSRHC